MKGAIWSETLGGNVMQRQWDAAARQWMLRIGDCHLGRGKERILARVSEGA